MLRWAELILLFIGVPVILALLLPPDRMWIILLASTALGIFLLHQTDGFAWRRLWSGRIDWAATALLGVVTLGAAASLCWWLLPEHLFRILRTMPWFIPVLSIGYPILLVLPQEIIFRPLFFERYGALFANQTIAVWVNAVLFAFAHLMYWHWVVFLLTFIGSFIFARAYLRGSFPHAVALHTIAGLMIFLSGLGWLFYSGGNVAQ